MAIIIINMIHAKKVGEAQCFACYCCILTILNITIYSTMQTKELGLYLTVFEFSTIQLDDNNQHHCSES